MAYNPILGRWMQQDPIGYVDGLSRYGYEDDDPSYSLDPAGTQTKPATAPACCCKERPDDCEIAIEFLGKNDQIAYTKTAARDWHPGIHDLYPPVLGETAELRVFIGGVPAHIYIKVKGGGDCKSCTLRQDVVDNWYQTSGGKSGVDKLGEDYSAESAKRHPGQQVYFGWELWDFPLRLTVYNKKDPKLGSVGQISDVYEKYFWQAKVTVEDVPQVHAKYWGWFVNGDFTKPGKDALVGSDQWSTDQAKTNTLAAGAATRPSTQPG